LPHRLVARLLWRPATVVHPITGDVEVLSRRWWENGVA
jgi:hypothetical protein